MSQRSYCAAILGAAQRTVLLGLMAGALAGCLGALSLPGVKGGEDNKFTGPPIEVTPLVPTPTVASLAEAEAEAEVQAGGAETADVANVPQLQMNASQAVPEAGPGEDPLLQPHAAAIVPLPNALKSPLQIACESKRGMWSKNSNGTLTCVHYTKDAAKRCTKSTQCESECLARSGSCAPYRPLLGCNEILDNMGRRMSQCVQ